MLFVFHSYKISKNNDVYKKPKISILCMFSVQINFQPVIDFKNIIYDTYIDTLIYYDL